MVIAEATTLATFEVIDREREVVQIGRGSFAAGRLRAPAIRACVEALARFVELARRHQADRMLCTPTPAVREPRNAGDFLRTARPGTGATPPRATGRRSPLSCRWGRRASTAPRARAMRSPRSRAGRSPGATPTTSTDTCSRRHR